MFDPPLGRDIAPGHIIKEDVCTFDNKLQFLKIIEELPDIRLIDCIFKTATGDEGFYVSLADKFSIFVVG